MKRPMIRLPHLGRPACVHRHLLTLLSSVPKREVRKDRAPVLRLVNRSARTSIGSLRR
jgi:hypothetical protein